jgi:hypothetical protein
MNRDTGHTILCHADALTALDGEHGMAGWIRRVCPAGDYDNLCIDIGDQPLHASGINGRYYKRVIADIEEVTGRAEGDLVRNGILRFNYKTETYGIGVIVNPREEREIFDVHPQGMIATIGGRSEGLGTPGLRTDEYYVTPNFGQPAIARRDLHDQTVKNIPRVVPIPINEGDRVLERDEIIARFPEINFNPPSPSSSSIDSRRASPTGFGAGAGVAEDRSRRTTDSRTSGMGTGGEGSAIAARLFSSSEAQLPVSAPYTPASATHISSGVGRKA